MSMTPEQNEITNEISNLVNTCKLEHSAQLKDVERKIDDLTKALTGDDLHTNGLVAKVGSLDRDVRSMKLEISNFRSGMRGLAIGIGLGAGVVGGGVAGAVVKLLG